MADAPRRVPVEVHHRDGAERGVQQVVEVFRRGGRPEEPEKQPEGPVGVGVPPRGVRRRVPVGLRHDPRHPSVVRARVGVVLGPVPNPVPPGAGSPGDPSVTGCRQGPRTGVQTHHDHRRVLSLEPP